MVVFGQSGCIQAKVVVFWNSCCIRESGWIRAKVVVFGQSGCNRVKIVVFG